MGPLTAPTVKKIRISQIQDGGRPRRFKNRYIIPSRQPVDSSRAWRKFQIFNFRQSYTADRRHLANRKTV